MGSKIKNFNREELDIILRKWARIDMDLGMFRDYFNGTMQSKFAYDNNTAVAILEHDIKVHKEIFKFLQGLYEMCNEEKNPLKEVNTSPLPTKNEYDDECSLKKCCRLMKKALKRKINF